MEDVEPILIFAYDEEAERSVPVTDEDMACGYLEDGWVVALTWTHVAVDEMVGGVDQVPRMLWSIHEALDLYRASNGMWAFRLGARFYQASKVRLSSDKVVHEFIRVADLQLGMVYMIHHAKMYVCLPDRHVRRLGDEEAWQPDPKVRPDTDTVLVCCTRPSMRFILK